MSPGDEFAPAIARMMADVRRLEDEANELKRTVNKLCQYANRPPAYSVADTKVPDVFNIRRDQFYGVPLATAVREYLSMRGDPKTGGLGATTVNEIFAALKEGGFAFDTKNDENAKRGLRISLAKNVAAFTKVPGIGEGAFGLTEWYPTVKSRVLDSSNYPKIYTNRAAPDPVDQEPPELESDVSTADQSDDTSEFP